MMFRSFVAAIPIAVISLFVCVPRADAVTPDSPEVQELIEKGLSYLEKATHDRVGGKCLIALSFKKNGRPASHPKIKEAVTACLAAKFQTFTEADNYDLPLMIIFLCELEDKSHKPLVERMLKVLLSRQKPNGGWGYDSLPQGDISQTQYAVLAMWTAHTHHIEVPVNNLAGVLNFLIRVQDPGGGWGYQADEPMGQGRVQQTPLTMSLGSAALGSVYMICDLLIPPGDPFSRPADQQEKSKLPPAVQEVINKNADAAALRRRPANNIRRAMQDGNKFLVKAFSLEETEWKFYACYAYERYFSFRETIDQTREPEPKWYNDMYADFKKHQKPDGSWEGGESASVNTSFGVLVLCRSTARAINRAAALGEGILLGGMGLPPDTTNLSEVNGKIVETKVTGDVDQLLNILGDKNNPLLETLVQQDQVVKLDGDVTKRAGQITTLRNMVTSGAPEARIVAVRSLAKARNYDQVPILLFALADKDYRVVREADRGLRFISRKFEGVMKLDALNNDVQRELRTAWRDWYLAIKPDAELLD
jgi:hypothetical protein